MSGLETAIRNALDRSNRADRDIRARIYQSARQALEAGLRKQGVLDRLIIMQQHEMLERKIHEIEMEEVRKLSKPQPAPEIELEFDPAGYAAPEPMPAPDLDAAPRARAAPGPESMLGGATRAVSPASTQAAPAVAPAAFHAEPAMAERRAPEPVMAEPAMAAPEASTGDLGGMSADRFEQVDVGQPEPQGRAKAAKPAKPEKPARAAKAARPEKTRGRGRGASDLDMPAERAAKPRRRRGFLSHLLTWMITLGIVGGACWYFYQSGVVQSFIEEAEKASDQQFGGSAANSPLDPRRAFSDDWVEVFAPSKIAALKAGAQAKADLVSASEGQAARIVSAVPGEGGDVSIEVPVDMLRNMAGKSSTIALSMQSGLNSTIQLSVRCDFGSLGACSRHRFTASQEKQDALFKVSFDRTMAPNKPGRLIVNSGLDGPDRPVLLYSVRILPGQ